MLTVKQHGLKERRYEGLDKNEGETGTGIESNMVEAVAR
jgi:hypothetical protein